MPHDLAGRVALVTGASSGIGEATAEALAAAGASVALTARRADRLDELAARIEGRGGRALALPGNVAEETFALAAVAATLSRFGRLDILVNSAGGIQATNLLDGPLDLWRDIIDVNLMACVYTCHAALAPMRDQGGGTIINVGSLACRVTTPVFNAYATSKHALFAMTDGLRLEAGPLGIRVCMVMPGTVTTGIWEGMQDAAHRDGMRDFLRQEGAIQPAQIADTIVYIAAAPPEVTISEMWVRGTTDIQF